MGFIFVFAAIVWITILAFRGKSYLNIIEACFIITKKNQKIVPIFGYEFSDNLKNTIEAVLCENKALRNLWESDPLTREKYNQKNNDEKSSYVKKDNGQNRKAFIVLKLPYDEKGEDKQPMSVGLLIETIEYLILHHLSLHLSEYFGPYPDEPDYIKEYQRRDIPSLLLENRILSLLTKPIEEREPFIDLFSSEEARPSGEIEAIFLSDGTKYERFSLVLPNRTSISRPKSGLIILDNNRIKLTFNIQYTGLSTVLPPDLIGKYIGINQDWIDIKNAKIWVGYHVKSLSLLLKSGWEYYRWVDSFANHLEKIFSISHFMDRIGWHNLTAHFHILSNKEISEMRKKDCHSEKNGNFEDC